MAKLGSGWNMPPGCYRTPWDYDYPCDVCGNPVDNCICPECPVCETVGNPDCYENHGLERTADQLATLANHKARWWAEEQSMQQYAEDFERDQLEQVARFEEQDNG